MTSIDTCRLSTFKFGLFSSTAFGGAALSVLIGAAATFAPSHHAAAQAMASSSDQLEEVVVTARKRSEALLEVPIAISALTSKDLEATGVSSLIDLTEFVPGFTVNNDGSNHVDRAVQTLYIRGMVSTVSPTVTVFIDGAPLTSGFIPSLSDAERVEVLKGPQSAFFGRETFGGALNIITKDPANYYAGSVDALYGSNNWYDVSGSLEGPIVKDKLTARLSARAYGTDGQYKSSVAPYAQLGGQTTKSVSLALKATPTDDLTVKLFGAYWMDKDRPAPVVKFDYRNYNCNAGSAPGGTPNFICGTLPNINTTTLPVQTATDALFQKQVIGNAGKTLTPLFNDLITTDGFERRDFHGHMNIDYDIADTGFTITSLTSGDFQQSEDIVDLDDTNTFNVPNFYHAFIPNTETFYQWFSRVQNRTSGYAQELRLTSDQTQPLRFTGGINYAHTTTQGYVDGLFPFGTANFGGGGPQIDDTEGVFGSISYDILPELTATFEGRYQTDGTKVYTRTVTLPNSLTAGARTHDFLPRAIVQYKVTPDIMVYATYSKGVNPAVFNTVLTSLPAQIVQEFKSIYGVGVAVKPEYLDNYEAGIKGKFFDNRLQLSFDGYYDEWTNQILSQFLSVPGIPGYNAGTPSVQTVQINAGVTHLYGVELDGQFEATHDLVLSFAGALNKSEIVTYPGYFCPGDSCTANGGVSNITGHNLANAPKVGVNLAATYTGELTSDIGWYGRGDYIYRGGQFTDLSNLNSIGASNRFNFRAGITYGTLLAEAFVLNAFNDKAYSSVNGTTDIDGQPNAIGAYPSALVVGPPLLRQFGVRVKYKFGEPDAAPAPTAAYVPPPVVAPKPAATARSYQVFFDFNKSDLTPQAVTIVDTAAKNAGPAKVTEIEVTGHTDTVGSDAYNMRLSRRRAESVAAELEKMGIPSKEIAIFAKGKKDLLVPTADGVKEPQNRRVQIVYAGGPSS
jgi:iron complex outermembrane receptor protein